ncbi:MAG TPA: trehalose-6-phosphate synthase [Streptosporangiaceae bacterium]|nr:trehalose-6-phosphate synthase [Streptosporangiaceae bacterium]
MTELVVCSHRGPVIFSRGQAGVQLDLAGPGGLVATVAPAVEQFGGTWFFAPASDHEAGLAKLTPGGVRRGMVTYRVLDLPRAAHHDHYATISTELLMPLFHYGLPLGDRPCFGERTRSAWKHYRLINSLYAESVSRHCGGDAALVEDVHLMLLAAAFRATATGRRRDLPLAYFHHVPWCEPDYFGVLPGPIRQEILAALLAYDSVGFHCRRWAEAFWACCERYLPGVSRAGDLITCDDRQTRLVISHATVDVGLLTTTLNSPRTREWQQKLTELTGHGDRELIVRVERADPAKNTVRGLQAYAALLDRRPALAEQTLLLAVLTPVRMWMPEYRRYLEDCQAHAAAINERFPGNPVCLHLGADAHAHDQHRALAALSLARAVMVTSTYDGCNLVAMEAVLAGAQPSLVLSENTGVHAWFGQYAFSVNPFDAAETSEAVERALGQADGERTSRAAEMRRIIETHTPSDWIRDRLDGLR